MWSRRISRSDLPLSDRSDASDRSDCLIRSSRWSFFGENAPAPPPSRSASQSHTSPPRHPRGIWMRHASRIYCGCNPSARAGRGSPPQAPASLMGCRYPWGKLSALVSMWGPLRGGDGWMGKWESGGGVVRTIEVQGSRVRPSNSILKNSHSFRWMGKTIDSEASSKVNGPSPCSIF